MGTPRIRNNQNGRQPKQDPTTQMDTASHSTQTHVTPPRKQPVARMEFIHRHGHLHRRRQKPHQTLPFRGQAPPEYNCRQFWPQPGAATLRQLHSLPAGSPQTQTQPPGDAGSQRWLSPQTQMQLHIFGQSCIHQRCWAHAGYIWKRENTHQNTTHLQEDLRHGHTQKLTFAQQGTLEEPKVK